MPIKDVRRLKPTTNEQLMNAIRNEQHSDYQRRVPEATKANIRETVDTLFKHPGHRNSFIDALVNRIGLVEARNTIWTNPLAMFKRGMLSFGDTIEQVQVGLVKARIYDPKREHLEKEIFGTHLPEVQSQFHTVNRQEYYPLTVNEAQLHQAFLEPGGLQSFTSQLMQAPTTSDNWDEFLLTCSLFAEMERAGAFFHVNIPDIRTSTGDANQDEAQAKTVLKKLRAWADTLKFVSTRYNAAHMPVHAQPEDLVLIASPEFMASIDVDALAGAFNIDRANMKNRTVIVPQERFGITDCQAILTTNDFFMIADQRIETTSALNPVSTQTNFFLHHWEVISASRFAPAVMFTTGAGDEVIEVNPIVTSVENLIVTDRENVDQTELVRGNVYNVDATVITDPEGGFNDGVKFSLSAHTSDYTSITGEGVLQIGGDELVSELSIQAISTWIDPDNPEAEPKQVTLTMSVTGEVFPEWPQETVPEAWAAETTYGVGDRVELSTGEVLEATVAGTSGTTEPTAPANVGDTVVDGTVTWERVS